MAGGSEYEPVSCPNVPGPMGNGSIGHSLPRLYCNSRGDGCWAWSNSCPRTDGANSQHISLE